MDGEEFPCDLVLLASSNANGKASVLTANLDGETNLKNQTAPLLTRSYRSDHLMTIKAQIECENPNPDLQGFVGRMTVGGHINDGGRSSLPTQKASRGTSHFQVLSGFLAFFPVPLKSLFRISFAFNKTCEIFYSWRNRIQASFKQLRWAPRMSFCGEQN